MVEQNYEKRLEKFYSGLNDKLQIYRKEKQSWDRFLSTDFNDFNVVSEFIRPNENRLSNIIKCLLEANGSHGQGSKFLGGFLKRLFKENQPKPVAEISCDQIQVNREDPTLYGENPKRRIDITIDLEGFGIGIENKPWAGEGDRQLEAYYEHLKCKYEDKFCLVFITPDGVRPESIKNRDDLIKKGELYCLSYSSDILKWIEECWQLCENDKFRWFLCDFREYIRAEFLSKNNEESEGDLEESKRGIILEHALKNEKNLEIAREIVSVGLELEIREEIAKPFQMEISERDIMLNHILENEKNLEIARDIISADSALRERITDNFWDEFNVFIKARLDRSQWDFHEPWSVTSKSLPKKVRIGLAGTIGRVNEQFIGIHIEDESLKPLSPTWNLLKSKLEEKLKEGYDRNNHHWIWKTPDWEYKDWTDKDTLIKMYTETDRVVTEIGKYFLEISEVAEEVYSKVVDE